MGRCNWKIRRLFILVLLFFYKGALAQFSEPYYNPGYVYKVWNNQSGLLQNTVLDIVTDTEGYLWVLTDEGLQRFDGYNFKVISGDNSSELNSSFISICRSSKSGIWAASRKSVMRIQPDTIRSYDFRTHLGEAIITCIKEDLAGRLWVGTNSGKLFYIEGGQVVPHQNGQLAREGLVIQVMEHGRDGMWLGTKKGLYFLKKRQATILPVPGMASVDVNALVTDNQQAVWVGTNGKGLYRLNGTIQQFTEKDGLKEPYIYSLALSPSGELWIGTRSLGIQTYLNGKFSNPLEENFLRDPIRHIKASQEHHLWIGTSGSGLLLVKPADVHKLSPRYPLSGKVILPIYQHPEGDIWLGTAGKGVNRITKGRSEVFSTNEGLAHNVVLSVYGDKKYIYLGTIKGLNRFKRESGKIDKHYSVKDGLASDIIQCVYKDSGNRIWVVTRSGGLHLLNKNGLIERIKIPQELSEAEFMSIFEDRQKNIWVGSDGAGMLRVDVNFNMEHFGQKNGLPVERVQCFYQDRDGDLWLGTDKGLVVKQADSFRVFNKNDGLKFNNIYSLVEDGSGHLLASGNLGIQRIPLASLLEAKKEKESSFPIPAQLFSTADGMVNNEANGGIFPAAWKMQGGSLWFPTVEGVAIIKPQLFNTGKGEVDLQIQAFRFGQREIFSFEKIVIPPGIISIEIDYLSIDFFKPADINYYYRLKGLDSGWVSAGNRHTAYFSALPPGHYRFEVKAEQYGAWSPVKSVDFLVAPFFYQTWWFRVIMLLVLVGIIASILMVQRKLAAFRIRAQLNITKGQIKGQEKERQFIGSELHDNINQKLTTVKLYLDFARSSDSARLAMIEKSEVVVNDVINEIRALSRSLIPPALKDMGLKEALQDLIDSYAVIDRMSVDLEYDPSLQGLDNEIKLSLYRIVQEQLNNIIKYAGAQTVEIEIGYMEGNILMEIRDDGKGFDATAKTHGVGFTNIRNRLQFYNGSCHIISSPGKGCTLRVRVPYQLAGKAISQSFEAEV